MRHLLPFLLFCFANSLTAQTTMGTILHDGLTRDYRLYVPPGLPPGAAPPLVFNFHGFTSNAQQQEAYSAMNAVADTAHFIVCYPNGIGNAWNVGTAGGSTADDVGFTAALIDTLQTLHGVDPGRVYACGMSNGGYFSYRLACELGNRIAATASVTGSMTNATYNACNPIRPMPIMHIHGDADPIVNYEGGPGYKSVEEAIIFWAAQNNCIFPLATGDFPDAVPTDQCTASFERWEICEDSVEVFLITVANGGHTWPGAIPTVLFGPTCQDFDASREIWVFFDRYHIEGPSATGGATPPPPSLSLFPNPFGNELRIAEGDDAEAYDATGRLVWQGIAERQVDTAAWPPGLYFLRVKKGNSVLSGRAVKR